jgi:hypothetical protein
MPNMTVTCPKCAEQIPVHSDLAAASTPRLREQLEGMRGVLRATDESREAAIRERDEARRERDQLSDAWRRLRDIAQKQPFDHIHAGLVVDTANAALADTSTPKPCERCGETMKHLGTMLAFAEEVEYRETVLYGYDDRVNEVRAWFNDTKDVAALADTHDEQTGGE